MYPRNDYGTPGAIIVAVKDIEPGDVLYVGGPVIESVELSGEHVRYHYAQRDDDLITKTIWMRGDSFVPRLDRKSQA